ncbi:exodeoxyribonuclease VII small subunit [Candidatus Foliamicus sp.]
MNEEAPAEGVQGLEQGLKELEQIVVRLEKGDLPLAEAIKQFERGVELTRHCQSALKKAEQKVQVLSEGMLENVDPQALEKDDTGSAPLF